MKIFHLFADDNEGGIMYSVHSTEESAKKRALKFENDLVEEWKDPECPPLVEADLEWTRDNEEDELHTGADRTYSGYIYTVKELKVL